MVEGKTTFIFQISDVLADLVLGGSHTEFFGGFCFCFFNFIFYFYYYYFFFIEALFQRGKRVA